MAIDSAVKRASALATSQPYLRLVIPDGSTDRAAALGMYNGFTSGPDVTAPTISSGTTAADGNSITFAGSEAMEFGAGGNTGFVLVPTNGGAAVTLSYSSGTGTSSLVYATSRAVSSTETLTYAYTQPGNGVQDAAGNDLVSFMAQAVTNNSTVNAAPSDIILTGGSVYANAGVNAPVGSLSVVDADFGDTATYTLTAGTGDTNNASFSISGANLLCDDPSVLGVGTYSVRITATDSASNTRAEAFTVSVVAASTVAVYSVRLQISIGIHI